MNYKNKQREKRALMDKLSNPRPVRGMFKNNRLRHETVKFQIAYLLLKQGYDVFPECEFKCGGRGDIVAIHGSNGFIIEVLDSETDAKLAMKLDYYPEEFTLIKVKVDDFDPETWCL